MEQKQPEKTKRWTSEIRPHWNIITGAEETMISLVEREMLGDPTWTAVLATQVVKIREADAALREIVPPEEYREAHATMLSATLDRLLEAEYILKGAQQLDPDLFLLVKDFASTANAKANLFRVMLETMIP
jgi:hypothetical protein